MCDAAWTCGACTYVHEGDEAASTRCAMCEAPKTKKQSSAQLVTNDEEDEDGYDDDDDDGYDDDDEEEDFGFVDPEEEAEKGVAAAADSAEADPTSAAESARDMAMEKDLAGSFAQGGSAQATKVLMKEYIRLQKLQARGANEGVTVSMPDEANGYRWRVAVAAPQDTPLAAELRMYAERYKQSDEIQLEMLFSADFPMSPPFVRVLTPRFAFHTGHVTIGGSICIELLTTSGWSPAYTIESLLVQLRSNFIAGEARLDPQRPNAPYSEMEAREAFRRVAQQHGWKV